MRPTRDEYFLTWAQHAATRGTCIRRQVGCVLINDRGHMIGSGYNGVEAGAPHCNYSIKEDGFTYTKLDTMAYPYACEGALLASGQGLEKCDAIHAEQNALLQCPDVFTIDTCYVTHSPCVWCVKLLLGTSCLRVVFRERYAHDEPARLKWLKNKYNSTNVAREWVHLP